MSTILITGANRGIGLGLVKEFKAKGHFVIATARNPEMADELDSHADQVLELDVRSEESIDYLVSALDGASIDTLVNNAGIYGPKSTGIQNVAEDAWLDVFQTNTIGPFLLTRALLPNLMAGKEKSIFFISSKVGSIADNGSGAGYMYRSSKTALNQVMKSLSIDLAGEGVKVASLHPGWVLTGMGGPNALISTKQSAEGLADVILTLAPEQSGCFLNYDGQEIPW